MSCDDFAESLSLLDFGEKLPPDEQARLDGHLATCPTCRARHALFDEIRAVAAKRPAGPLPELSMSLVEHVKLAKREVEARARNARILRAGIALALAVLLVAGAYRFFHQPPEPVREPREPITASFDDFIDDCATAVGLDPAQRAELEKAYPQGVKVPDAAVHDRIAAVLHEDQRARFEAFWAEQQKKRK